MTDQPSALVERQGHVLVVTMNRPAVKNAISPAMAAILCTAWDQVNGDPGIRVCVLTGAGGNFSAGADLRLMSEQHPYDEAVAPADGPGISTGDLDPLFLKPLLKGYRLDKPLISAVEGYAIAGGTELVLSSDIRVAAESARFGLAEVSWGLFPMAGSTLRLPRHVPYTFAADLLLTGRQIAAAEAYQRGLVGHLVPDGAALGKAMELAGLIAANGPVAVRNILRAMRATEALPEAEGFLIETQIGVETFQSDDAKEGPLAFTQKRRPAFKGR
jgi:enoyl-CoA hydratase